MEFEEAMNLNAQFEASVMLMNLLMAFWSECAERRDYRVDN